MVYSLVTASDMEDWFDEDVSIHCFPDTELQDLSLHQQPHKSISGNETLNTMTTLKLQEPSSFGNFYHIDYTERASKLNLYVIFDEQQDYS